MSQAAPAAPAAPILGTAVKASPQPQRAPVKPKPVAKPLGDEIYLNQVLNNRFKIESKIGEGGFGAVYRGVQLATGRKVALKLLHPEMTKDENLVARFRREGMVLCNLRDAHTITTYDFDQTQDGTLYIAMELLEGKSLHQVFHEQAPLEWKRVFKILIEMCSSLAEAHSQGIVHRDLKPENVYLESRPGNPEFVKILDFGIAKVMRGDSIDPQSPQLTATGQTLGTLEYMSPEQLMGKQLDGRSDVYALGVVAYEMITGGLPFPDAKGPAGLITAQLKQTPQPPSTRAPKAALPPSADRAILKALEKSKENRHADVTAMAAALQDVLDEAREKSNPVMQALPASASQSHRQPQMTGADLLETKRAPMPDMAPPPVPAGGPMGTNVGVAGMNDPLSAPQATPNPLPRMQQQQQPQQPYGTQLGPQQGYQGMMTPPPVSPYPPSQPMGANQLMTYPQASPNLYGETLRTRGGNPSSSTKTWIYWLVGLLILGGIAGAAVAFLMNR
ncbi:MAG: serine/threonine-protein kinase [Kofleriaceae bacterium]